MDKQTILDNFNIYNQQLTASYFSDNQTQIINDLLESLTKLVGEEEFEECATILKRGIIMFSSRAKQYGVLSFNSGK
jgi:hypothetical protein